MVNYRWGQVSYRVPAQVAGDVMERLERKGQLTPVMLVEVSRPQDAPLHGCFEWDDVKAAEGYRVIQARNIIRAIEVVRDDGDGNGVEPVRIRAFHALQDEDSNGYESLERILSDREKTQRLMALARRDMEMFRDKYRTIGMLSGVMSAIDDVLGEEDAT